MVDIKFIRDNKDKIIKAVKNRGVKLDIIKLLDLDEKRRKFITDLDNARKEQNELSEKISREKNKDSIKRARSIKDKISLMEKESESVSKEFESLMIQIPNIPLDSVPVGESEKDNKVLREWGKKRNFEFKPKDYLEISESLDLIDVQRAGKVSGTRFGYIKGRLAQVEFALVQLAFEILSKENFIPIVPPVLIKPESMRGMGYIDSLADQEERYFFEKDNLYLVGTSEQSIGPMHQDEVFDEKELPRRYVAFSTCFRREAGSYGKDTKGILRVHQFDKVEMFSYSKPEDSEKEHQFILSMEEKLMQLLNIPYRVVALCTADIAKPSAATFDIESWLPGQNQYRETHSCSNTTEFQSRRLNVKYKSANGKNGFVYMLNGTAFAIGRTLIAIVENYQEKDGKIAVPDALQRYLPFKVID